MNNTENKETLVTVPETGLLTLVAAALKDVALFPEKLEDAKKYIDNARMKTV